MIVIFDLDDTLYDEMNFVRSGIAAVAQFGERVFNLEKNASNEFMLDVLAKRGRGAIFDLWLTAHNLNTKSRVKTCVSVYRNHKPKLSLPERSRVLLHSLSHFPLYLVTDGHKVVQSNKVAALDIEPYFKRIFVTHRFGIKNAKPSTHCFEIIKRAEKCNWDEMAYIGDNPAKDFVNLNSLGVLTIRVLRGSYASVIAQQGFDAAVRVDDVGDVPFHIV